MQGAIVCDRWREMPAEKVEEGDMGRPHLRRQCRLEGQRRARKIPLDFLHQPEVIFGDLAHVQFPIDDVRLHA